MNEINTKYPDYKFVGYLNCDELAYRENDKSREQEWVAISNTVHVVLLHDLKEYVIVDSGD